MGGTIRQDNACQGRMEHYYTNGGIRRSKIVDPTLQSPTLLIKLMVRTLHPAMPHGNHSQDIESTWLNKQGVANGRPTNIGSCKQIGHTKEHPIFGKQSLSYSSLPELDLPKKNQNIPRKS